jgi:cytochrome c553
MLAAISMQAQGQQTPVPAAKSPAELRAAAVAAPATAAQTVAAPEAKPTPPGVTLTSAPASSSASSGKPDLARAQQIAGQVCASCHGAEGISAAPVNPHLAGQHAGYTALQLDHFKSGLRKNPVMQAMAAQLTAEEQRALGLYFADKKPKPGAAKDKALAELGQKIYRGGNAKTGLPPCAACHSPNGAGIPVQYPRLAGQFSDYVYAQLQGFVKGDRGGEMKTPQGKIVEDAQGKVMAGIASKMSDREMRAVAEYVSGLR